ncbi:uncharacterized protein E0L32_009259 [Thyridium curvatum]|uniref:DNA repair protein RAD50 n=1 Tax=Thyridium curvatum TaxID=1093900 RepID=A0A507AS41_9PEZI|nr:uncharacterized protein E0L32_009259 [Thyridium curvatum]TPX09516.1 hypothetical protein E0L32_009259 [Thyridium curvatum]
MKRKSTSWPSGGVYAIQHPVDLDRWIQWLRKDGKALNTRLTIIECLKYATTGEQPPNSKGGAFIHDPKLCGEREVMAQVKLSFRPTSGGKMVVTRSIQVTMKKNTRSMKTLDGSLVIQTNGERSVVSQRAAELDKLVPDNLGVPPAILDAVIFCHQDESLWPLSEPSTLKKKFDEIFDAQKYTKAIDNLKVLRKKQGEDLSKAKIFEASEKVNKEKAEKAEKRARDLEAELEQLRADCEEVDIAKNEVETQMYQKREQARSFQTIVNDLENKKDKYDDRKEAAEELRVGLEELTEPDDYLAEQLAQYEDRMQRMDDERKEKTNQYNQLQKEVSESRALLGTKHAEQGRHQSDKEKYERQLQTRVTKVREAAQKHEIRGYDGDLTDNMVHAFNDRIQKVLADKKRELERLQRENEKELDKETAAINNLEGRKAARTQDRVTAKQRMAAIEKKLASLQTTVQNLNFDEGAQAILEANFKDLESRLKKALDELNGSDIDSQIQQENDRLWQLESESDRLSRELVECTRLASERAQLDLRKKELTERRRNFDTLKNTWDSKLTSLIGGSWKPELLEDEFNNVVKQRNTTVSAARKQVEATQQELRQVEYKLSSIRDKQQKSLAESTKCQATVLNVLKTAKDSDDAVIEDYQEEIENFEGDILSLEKDITLFDHLKEFYSKSQTTLNKYNKCSLCERQFVDQPRERSRLLEKIAKSLNAEHKKEIEKDKDEREATLGQLRAVRSQYDTYKRLESELPALRNELKAAEAQREGLVRVLEDNDAAYKEADEQRQDVESLSKTVMNIAQTFREIQEAEKQIDRLASQQQSGAPSRSAEEINELQATCAEQIRAAKGKVAKLTSDKQRMRDSVNSLELEKSELTNKIGHIIRQSERRNDLLGQIQSLKDENTNQRELIQQADRDMEALEPEIAKARSIREDTLQRGRGKEQKLVTERDSIAHTVSELNMIEAEIQDYIDRGGPAALAANARAIQALEQTIANLEKEISELATLVNKLKSDLDNSDRKKKTISDNLTYRKNMRILETLKREIEELESRHAVEDYEHLKAEVDALEKQHNVMHANRGAVMAKMRSKDEELGRVLEEWEQEYKDASAKYREAHIRVETTKAAIEDLGRYSSALDKAIMQYHSLKMEEVNRIAGELWQATYQGTDIDTILIRSESETATGKRNYNYRLCMVKQDTEMDMRGRCSAGQKVLASIIIRLALAESFGVNCGLIALDEPTTNLDSDNIRSLAVSLHAIIKARQAQANFQLIVITHDEEFLRHMQVSDFCDTFYRVRRDEKQNSVILRESISKLIEG